jgi:hypothetical protein
MGTAVHTTLTKISPSPTATYHFHPPKPAHPPGKLKPKHLMATHKQIAANRRNAQKSTGPRTPEGRAAVRLNGVTHGLTAETLILKTENEADFSALLESLEAEHQPTTPTEETLVAQLALAAWRLRRLHQMEAGYYKFRLNEQDDYATRKELDDTHRLGLFADSEATVRTLTLLGRQEARLERSFYNALHELQRLRAQRTKERVTEKVTNQTQFQPETPARPAPPTQWDPLQPPPPSTNPPHVINISNAT